MLNTTKSAGAALLTLTLTLVSTIDGYPQAVLGPAVKKVVAMGWTDEVSPAKCTFKQPCPGLERGTAIQVELRSKGFAAVFIQDGAYYYQQEGRPAVVDGVIGDIQLYPGTPKELPSKKTYKLFVVTTFKQTPGFNNSASLPKLPDGEVWGPAYLQTK